MEIIQQSKDNSCVACVLAMFIGESEQYVLDWFENDDLPFCDDDVIIFLAHHGIYFAFGFDFESDNSEGVSFKDIRTIVAEIDLHERVAYLIVQSPFNKERKHAVLMKNYMIYDPLFPEPQKVENYKIFWVYPLMTTAERRKNFKKEI